MLCAENAETTQTPRFTVRDPGRSSFVLRPPFLSLMDEYAMSGLKDGECPKCGSKEVVDNAQFVDHSHHGTITDAVVRLITRPNALFFKDPIDFKLQPYICGECGYLESYVEKPDRLAAHSRKLKEATDQ